MSEASDEELLPADIAHTSGSRALVVVRTPIRIAWVASLTVSVVLSPPFPSSVGPVGYWAFWAIVAVGVLLLVLDVLLGRAEKFFKKGQLLLENEYRTCRQKLWRTQGDLQRAKGFIDAFTPSQEQVDEHLRGAAQTVLLRQDALAQLYMERVSGLFRDLDVITESFKERVREHDVMFAQARHQFWDLWNLISETGRFTLKKAWEPYAGMPWEEPNPLDDIREGYSGAGIE